MGNGMVIVTSSVLLGEPSSVLSPLSDLTPGFNMYRVILSKLVS